VAWQRRDKWRYAVLGAGLEGASTYFAVIQKHVLKQTFRRPKYATKQRVTFGKKLQKNIILVRIGLGYASTHFVVI